MRPSSAIDTEENHSIEGDSEEAVVANRKLYKAVPSAYLLNEY